MDIATGRPLPAEMRGGLLTLSLPKTGEVYRLAAHPDLGPAPVAQRLPAGTTLDAAVQAASSQSRSGDGAMGVLQARSGRMYLLPLGFREQSDGTALGLHLREQSWGPVELSHPAVRLKAVVEGDYTVKFNRKT